MPIALEVLSRYLNDVFVETGTYQGATVKKALEAGFKKIYTIELDQGMYDEARIMFAGEDRVELVQGDTIERFPEVLERVSVPATIWLDAHAGPLPPGGEAFPVLRELQILKNHPVKTHTILIDDRRLIEKSWKLSEKDIGQAILDINPDYRISYEAGIVDDDIIVATLPAG